MKKQKNLILGFSVFLFLSVGAIAATSGNIATGFELLFQYLTAFKTTIQILVSLIGIVLFVVGIGSFFADSSQWDEVAKKFLGAALCFTVVWGIEKIVKVLGGSTYDKAKFEQIQIHEKSNDENHIKKLIIYE